MRPRDGVEQKKDDLFYEHFIPGDDSIIVGLFAVSR